MGTHWKRQGLEDGFSMCVRDNRGKPASREQVRDPWGEREEKESFGSKGNSEADLGL